MVLAWKVSVVVFVGMDVLALADSTVSYTVEMGGDNHVEQWEAGNYPSFSGGTTDNSQAVRCGDDITWAVRVGVSGVHSNPDGPGDGSVPWGMANLVFDLELYHADAEGNPDATPLAGFGAAPLSCSTGTAGEPGALECRPSGGGFWSSINDGDADGSRGAYGPDVLANAAFANAISAVGLPWNQIPWMGTPAVPAIRHYRLIDAPQGFESPGDPDVWPDAEASPRGGPGFDYGWYPASNGRSGTEIGDTHPIINTTVSGLDGRLVGFSAGYKDYVYTSGALGNGYLPGVAVADALSTYDDYPYVFPGGSFPYSFGWREDSLFDRPLFEGQISTIDMAPGTYVLKVIPSPSGSNILHHDVQWMSRTHDYGTFPRCFTVFAAKANAVIGSEQKFEIVAPVVRRIFYNGSFYDGNNIGINAEPVAGQNNDDLDAVDTSKTPLLPGAGTASFANWIGHIHGITGLIYDVAGTPAQHTVTLDDFEFRNIGRQGTSLPGATVIPSGFLAVPDGAGPGITRCIITFAPDSISGVWLQVDVKTSIGLPATDTSYWGSAPGDVGNDSEQDAKVLTNSSDYGLIGQHFTGIIPRRPIDWAWDINKDGACNATDTANCVTCYNGPTTCLKRAYK